MAIQESDYMDFGNGIIGDDTFDVWRKKTNSIKVELDSVNATLTSKINTDIANLSTVYIPQAGSATSVSTALQFTSPTTFASNVLIGDSTLSSLGNKLNIDKEVDSSVQLTSAKVRAKTNLILGDKTYNVPSSPAINNAVLVAQTNGTLSWQNVASIFELSGGLNQTTTVFEEVMPVGSVIPLAANPNDPNYLLCEGGYVSKSTYPDLYNVLKNGTDTCIYGENPQNTNEFRLPDYSGRVVVGTGGTGVTFPTTFGVTGGTDTRSTSGHTLTIDQIPAHRHWSPWVSDDALLTAAQKTDYKNSPLFGADASDVTLTDRIHFDTGNIDATTTNNDYYAFTTYAGGASGDASLTGLTDVNNVQYTGGATTSHSHNITAANRVQPYITVKWYIKAKKNTKIDFKIDIANSGLKSTTFGGEPQTLISPVNETIQLDIDPDNTSIALDNNYKVSIKSSPTIQGPITVVSGEPTQSNHLTTKNYVDTSVSNVLFTESFESEEIDVPAANDASVIVNHSLSSIPKIVQAVYRCKTDDNGWSVGDEIIVTSDSDTGSMYSTLVVNSTQIKYRSTYDRPIYAPGSGTNVGFRASSPNWKLVFKAYA